MFKLPALSEAIPRILAAVEAGKLQAQILDQRKCSANYSGPCAVGFLMPDSVRQDIDKTSDYAGVWHIVESSNFNVEITNDDEVDDYSRIQRLHDSWHINRSELAKKKFLDALHQLKEKYPCTPQN